MTCTQQQLDIKINLLRPGYVVVKTMVFGVTLFSLSATGDLMGLLFPVSATMCTTEKVLGRPRPAPPPHSSTSVVTCVLGPGPAPVLSPVEAPLPETRHEAPRSPRPGHRLRRLGRRHRGGGVDTEGQESVLPVQHRAVPQRGVRHHRHQRQGGGLHHQLGVHRRGGHRLRKMRLGLRR